LFVGALSLLAGTPPFAMTYSCDSKAITCVCVCMCVCVCVCLCVCVITVTPSRKQLLRSIVQVMASACPFIARNVYRCTRVYMYTHTHIYIYIFVYIYTYTCAYRPLHAHLSRETYIDVYIYMYSHKYIYICTYK